MVEDHWFKAVLLATVAAVLTYFHWWQYAVILVLGAAAIVTAVCVIASLILQCGVVISCMNDPPNGSLLYQMSAAGVITLIASSIGFLFGEHLRSETIFVVRLQVTLSLLWLVSLVVCEYRNLK